MKRGRALVAGVAVSSMALLSARAAADDGPRHRQLVITHAIADFSQETLTIEGRNFGEQVPIVTLGQTRLEVLSSDPSQIVAFLPSTHPHGTFPLSVRRTRNADGDDDDRSQGPSGKGVGTLDVTIGAVGPAGPPGAGAACFDGDFVNCYTGSPGTRGAGRCVAGTRTCENAAFGACVGEILPGPESCDGSDEDCDGSLDNGVGLPGCAQRYPDADGDGYGSSVAGAACLCPQSAASSANNQDCHDSDANTKPGQAAYFSVPRPQIGGFDYNCNGTEEAAVAQLAEPCIVVDEPPSCEGSGWESSVPVCGQSGNFQACELLQVGSFSFICRRSTVANRVQACR